jgi:hypothetical protein
MMTMRKLERPIEIYPHYAVGGADLQGAGHMTAYTDEELVSKIKLAIALSPISTLTVQAAEPSAAGAPPGLDLKDRGE